MAIDLNSASAEDLMRAVPRLGRDRADKIVRHREESGGFKSWEDVKKAPGFPDGMIEDLQDAGVTLESERESATEGA